MGFQGSEILKEKNLIGLQKIVTLTILTYVFQRQEGRRVQSAGLQPRHRLQVLHWHSPGHPYHRRRYLLPLREQIDLKMEENHQILKAKQVCKLNNSKKKTTTLEKNSRRNLFLAAPKFCSKKLDIKIGSIRTTIYRIVILESRFIEYFWLKNVFCVPKKLTTVADLCAHCCLNQVTAYLHYLLFLVTYLL